MAAEADVQFQKLPPEVFYKKAVLKSFANFTGEHLYWSLFLITLQVFRPEPYQEETPTQVISCEICKIFKNVYFEEYLRTTASVVSFSWLYNH